MNKEIDVRHVLPAVRVPTLILHGSEDTIVTLEVARYVASRIPTARLVEIPGLGHLAFWNPGAAVIAEEIERFLQGRVGGGRLGGGRTRPPSRHRPLHRHRRLDCEGDGARRPGMAGTARAPPRAVRRELVRFRGAELDVAGDGFFARFDGPARAIRCACAITEGVRELALEVRAGLQTGECEVMDGKVGGIAVHIGARVAREAQPSEVLVSSTVKDLVAGSGLRFRERGSAVLKGVAEEWRLYSVERAG